tara:strand:- start:12804 stop:14897 length:2094 start_codon:yes stop_codon:yes gene_type:complete
MAILRDYQIEALDQIKSNDGISVLAACPGAGKTTIVLEYLKTLSVGTKVLILPHGTTVINTHWQDQLTAEGIEYSTDFTKDITVGLPQSIKKKLSSKIDILIVDEAHEFYFAEKMIPTIIEKYKPTKQILLTGTPSKFVKAGYKIINIAAERLLKDGYLANLYVGLVSTTLKLKDDDFNASGDAFEKSLQKFNTNKTLDNLLKGIKNRLEQSITKDKPNWPGVVKWADVLGRLDKTVIACRTIKQATETHEYFQKHKVNSVLSTSDNDLTSDEINKFKADPAIQILIVVNRAILGFDMSELVNVVDMTCSRNIDRIYQLMARVMRKSKTDNKKYFFKIVGNDEKDLGKFYMAATLCLIKNEFISTYNGSNLNGFEIPVMRTKRGANVTGSTKAPKQKLNTVELDRLFMEAVPTDIMFTALTNRDDKDFNEFAFTKLGDVRNILTGFKFYNAVETKRLLLQMAKNNELRPKYPTSLAICLGNYTNYKNKCYDEKFTNSLESLRPDWFIDIALNSRNELLDLAKNQKNKPKQATKLGWILNGYLMRKFPSLEIKEFIKKLKEYAPFWFEKEADRRKRLSFERMMRIMPNNVKFKEGQKWEGTDAKYTFIDDEYGEFVTVPSSLTKPWKQGRSGHPQRGRLIVSKHHAKSVKNLTTGQIYGSATMANKELKCNVHAAIRKNKTAGGYRWAYCDDEGNVVE